MPTDQRQLRIQRALWSELLAQLHKRSAGMRESGAFLLGRHDDAGRTVTELLFFEALEPRAYDHGIVELSSQAYRKLWAYCRTQFLRVVADVHVHPGSARQSTIDRRNPLVAVAGHISIILPNFARPRVRRWSVGVYEYLGEHQWVAHGGCGGTMLRIDP